jgi:hypothetical protein
VGRVIHSNSSPVRTIREDLLTKQSPEILTVHLDVINVLQFAQNKKPFLTSSSSFAALAVIDRPPVPADPQHDVSMSRQHSPVPSINTIPVAKTLGCLILLKYVRRTAIIRPLNTYSLTVRR